MASIDEGISSYGHDVDPNCVEVASYAPKESDDLSIAHGRNTEGGSFFPDDMVQEFARCW